MQQESNNPGAQSIPMSERERVRAHYRDLVASDPQNADAWVRLSYSEPDPRTALDDIQHAIDLKPQDPAVQAALEYILFQRLRYDPFVEFLAETDKNYVVTLRHSRPVVIPKERARSEVFPPPRLSESERIARMVGWMAFGLIPAGLGAFVLAPVVIKNALQLLRRRGLPARDHRVALVSLAMASIIGLAGEALFGLLLLHWFG